MDLKRMAILAEVVERGSMRRAARSLSLTPSAVSQHIRQLERDTSVTLLRRSTRRLTLTDAGQAFYEGCAAMVAAARSAHERLTALQEGVVGELSISAPVGFAASHLTRALVPLLDAHPQLLLRIIATDDLLDITRERIDLAITIGTAAPATSLIRRHLADWPNIIVAAPSYLARKGTPSNAEALTAHEFVALPTWHHPHDILTDPDGRQHILRVKRRVTSNNQLTLKLLALAGCGLSFTVEPEVAAELADGRLVQVLPECSLPMLSVDALLAPRVRQPAKVRAALAALAEHLPRGVETAHKSRAARRAGQKRRRRPPRT